jgi:putative salt-induced outer membrane protein
MRRTAVHARLLCVVALAGAAPAARAQAPAAAPSPWRAQIDLSYVQAAGNTRLTTLQMSDRLTYTAARWTLAQTFTVVNGSSGGVETANSLKLGGRADYRVAPRLRGYGLAGFERDRFAGLARRLTEEAGLSWGAVAAARDTVDVEAGLGLTQEKGDTTAARDFASSRGAVRVRHVFRENTYVEARSELLLNLQRGDDYRVNGELALVAPLSRRVALRVGYTLRFDNTPEPTKRRTDTVTSAGLQIVL